MSDSRDCRHSTQVFGDSVLRDQAALNTTAEVQQSLASQAKEPKEEAVKTRLRGG